MNQALATETCMGLLESSQRTVGGSRDSYNFQLLGNADILQDSLKDSFPEATDEQKARFSELIEKLIKHPLRRQIGRMRAAERSLDEAMRLIRKQSPA